jgi:hypothetical protein
MDWKNQLTPVAVAEMRTVDGLRHDFVNRQYDMILEYREKEDVFNIIGPIFLGNNRFSFRLTTGLGRPAAARTQGGVC